MIDNDAWDNMIYKWRKSKWDLLCLTGNLVYWMTYYIQKLTFQMYKFVQKEYLKLSRNMEYNADTIAANSIGKKAFISSLYKVEIISVIDDFYNNILRHMISKNEIVANYETGYKIVEQRIKEYENYDFSEKKFITEDYKHECPSKIKLEQIWSTHPSLDDRVINIERAKGCKTNELDKRPSLLLVNENIRQKIYADKLNSIIEESDAAPATIDNNTFDKFIYDTLFSKKISRQMLPFFDRNIISFDPDDNYNIPKQNPFNKKNTYAIKEFFRDSDYYVLQIGRSHV